MKNIKDLKENEVIVCRSEQEAIQIRQLMHDAGFKWCTGESYIEKEWYYKGITYSPKRGTHLHLSLMYPFEKRIHEAKDFIMEEKEQENEQPNTITLPLVNGVPDISNCGVEMLVSDDNVHWEKVFINFYDKSFDLPFRNDLEGFTYAKPLPKKITKQEAEKLLNNEFEIVD